MTRRRSSSPVVPIAAICLAASACGGPAGDAGKYATGGTFTYAIPEDPRPFDPYHSIIFGYSGLAYDTLVHIDPDGKFVSGLAEKWTADARSATFTLRPDVTCSDGTPLTAGQVVAAIKYNADPKNQSKQYSGTVPTEPMAVTADDAARTVKIEMTGEPYGFLLYAVGQLPIVCAKGLKDPNVLKTGSSGTGPYVLTRHVPGQSYTFAVRKDYKWGPNGASTSEPGTPAKIVLRVVPNETTAANLLISGEVNMARITGADQERLTAQGLKKIDVPGAGTWLRFNQLGNRPTADKRLRQALAKAIDIDKVIKVSTGGTGGASTGLIAMNPRPCTGDSVAGSFPRQDVAAAGALLDEAGWTKGADGIRAKGGMRLTLDLHYLPIVSPYEKPTAELIAEELQAIGVKIKLASDTLAGYAAVMYQSSNWDLYLANVGAFLPSQAVKYVSGAEPPNGVNGSGIENKDYDALVAKAKAQTPPAACTSWEQAEKALFREIDIMPISNRPAFYFMKNARARAQAYDLPIPTSIRLLKN